MAKTALSVIEQRITENQGYASRYFFSKYPTKEEREVKQEILDEVLEQIEVCEELYRPVTEKQIQDWLDCESVIQVSRKARSHKFAA